MFISREFLSCKWITREMKVPSCENLCKPPLLPQSEIQTRFSKGNQYILKGNLTSGLRLFPLQHWNKSAGRQFVSLYSLVFHPLPFLISSSMLLVNSNALRMSKCKPLALLHWHLVSNILESWNYFESSLLRHIILISQREMLYNIFKVSYFSV